MGSDIISIAVCDDDLSCHHKMASFCDIFFKEKSVDYEFHSYYSGEEILEEHEKNIDLLFLDIEMGEVDGIEAMKRIESMPNIHRIIFISSHLELIGDAFGYKPIGFIVKPIDQNIILKKLDDLYHRIKKDSVIEFNDSESIRVYRKSDVVFIKADSNYVTVVTQNDEKILSCTLKKCEEQINGLPFLRVHKSYIVNLCYVKKISAGNVFLKSGITIPVGRSYSEMVKKEYQKYLIEELNS
ncbi:MAG: LytTR family DNA-binding domain-containing protein [Eubacterium sp.]|nr:LytTR family DNA-binding domain-containing protein [Eubacterium sp.]